MSDTFDKAFSYTVGNEGRYSNDPGDAGGPTMYGITIHDLSVFLGRPARVQEVKDMHLEVAKTIYQNKYWNPLGCPSMTSIPIAMAMFDIGVVMGIGVPPRFAQEICNEHGSHLVVDGHIGPLTLDELNTIDPKHFVTDFSHFAEARFRAIAAAHANDRKFLKGWVSRARRLLTLV